MKCPRCVQEVQSAIHECSHCGFSLSQVDGQFGEECVVLERLTDAAECLSPEERRQLIQFMDGFEQKFPQLFLALYIGELPELTSVRQFGFWLLNRAAVPSVDYTRPNENGILLVLDLTSRSLNLTLGYFLEEYLAVDELERVLDQGNAKFAEGEFGEGFLRILRRLGKELRRKGAKASRDPSNFAGNTRQKAEGVLRRLRSGHRFGGKSKQKERSSLSVE